MTQEVVNVAGTDPEFIDYLLNKAIHETYFLVGKEKTKIGAVKLMLAAHSDVLRSELLDSPIADKRNINWEDISPRTFKNLLRYVYGYNTISKLSFDEADDLLYTADKYLITNLKAQLVLRLMDLLDCTNICILLNNPACHTVLELDAKITEILQYETDAVFESPDFINLRVEGFIKILEQDALVVPEWDVWKAALKWAKNQDCSRIAGPKRHIRRFSAEWPLQSYCAAGITTYNAMLNREEGKSPQLAKSTLLTEGSSEDGSILRKCISQLKHIRIRTFKHEDIFKEVVPTGILSYKEVIEICDSYGKDEPPPYIMGFSGKTYSRQINKNEFNVPLNGQSSPNLSQSSFTITPKNDVFILPLEFQANNAQAPITDYQCECVIEIKHLPNNSSLDPKVTVKFNKKVDCGKIFKVPLPAKYKRLSAKKTYAVTITFSAPHKTYTSSQNNTCENLSIQSHTCQQYYIYHFGSLKYINILSK